MPNGAQFCPPPLSLGPGHLTLLVSLCASTYKGMAAKGNRILQQDKRSMGFSWLVLKQDIRPKAFTVCKTMSRIRVYNYFKCACKWTREKQGGYLGLFWAVSNVIGLYLMSS